MSLRVHNGKLINPGLLRKELIDVLMPSDEKSDPALLRKFVPQPRQREVFRVAGLLDWFEGTGPLKPAMTEWIGFGGAAYGGKTYNNLGIALVAAYAYPGVQIGYFRRTYKELEGAGSAIHDAYEVFAGVATPRDSGRVWKFGDTGSALYFQHCENEQDVHAYQSKQFDILIMDEATHFTWFQMQYLHTRNCISGPNGLPRPFKLLTSNPGGIGHSWYMQLFGLESIDKWIKGVWNEPISVVNPSNERSETYFIPSFINDNQVGVKRDPGYEKRLREADPDLADALINGDWSIFSGMAFRTFDRTQHVIKQENLPSNFKSFPKWRAVDWGSDAPFCCLWFAKDPDIGRIYVYREAYQPGLTDSQQATTIVMNTPPEEAISITYGDPISFATRRSRGEVFFTPTDEYRDNGVIIFGADNDRISGKRKVDQLLAPLPDGKPGLMITDNCINLIRTLPKLARSKVNPEDVDKDQEDHAYSALRYGLTNPGMHSKKQTDNQPSYVNPWTRVPGI